MIRTILSAPAFGLTLAAALLPASAATFSVASTGNDSNPGSASQPFQTVQRGVDAATAPGDVVMVHAGAYGENVVTKASGNSGNPITIRAAGDGEASIRTFRANNHPWGILDGLTIMHAQNTFGHHVRIEASAHNWVFRNCVIRDSPLMIRDDFRFSHVTNSISSPSGSDWAAAGFIVGGYIYTGASGYGTLPYANHDQVLQIAAITNNVLYTVQDLITETNLSAWAAIFPGPQPGGQGVNGFEMMQTGGATATNIAFVGNTVSNLYGSPFVVRGNGPVLVQDNFTHNTYSRASIHPHANNLTVQGNVWVNSTNWIYYHETEPVPHPAGPGWYDFIQGHVHTFQPGTNVVFRRNWWENIQQPWTQISEISTSTNWVWESNVVVGVQKAMNNGVNGTMIRNNTFHQVSFDDGQSGALTIGGNSPSNPVTNMWILRNAFIDVGDHSSTNQEGFYNLVNSVNSGAATNFVAGPETTAWQGKRTFAESAGINGGNPILLNPQNPRGADGVAFTEDDGLRPLPNSPLALLSIGALDPVSVLPNTPIAHFTVRPAVPGWYDATGTNFDPGWIALEPYQRTNLVRPWRTPEALGNVPCQVLIDAGTSISGFWSTNSDYGIKLYTFDWGDGSVIQSWTATNSHTYLWPGTFTVTTIVENWVGVSATNTRTYRVLPQGGYPGVVYHVSTGGNDTAGNGTLGAPWRTVTKAVSIVGAGDYIAVHPGDYEEYVDVNRNVATQNGRVSIIGYGATMGGAQFRHPNWTFEGFDVDQTPNGPAGNYVFQAADNTWLVNNLYHDLGGQLFGAVYAVGGGDKNPMNQSLNGRIIGCTFSNINSPCIQIFGGSNWMVSNFRALNTVGEGDFIRPRGVNHTIQDGYTFGLDSGGTGGHPDFLQLDNQEGDGYWFRDIVVQRVFVEGNTNSTSDSQIAQIESGHFADNRYTNLVFRNCVFKNVRGPINDSNDGLKIYNCLFYRSPRDGGLVTTGGGVRGSSYGMMIYNNILYGCGLTDNDNTGWYQNGLSTAISSNTTVFADYNFVAGITGEPKQAAPPNDVFHWGIPGQEANGINGGDPLFVNEATGDFRLASGSPLLDAGMNLSALGVTHDYLGQPRPVGAAFDIGPFESIGESPVEPSQPRLEIRLGPEGEVVLWIHGTPGMSYLVEVIPLLGPGNDWTTWSRMAMTSSSQQVPGTVSVSGFFRVRELAADPPLLEARMDSTGSRSLVIFGEPGVSYRVEYATNLSFGMSWILEGNTSLTGSFEFVTGLSTVEPVIFYRVSRQ